MKVAVVGGGFTGCMAALHSARQGHEVTLWESAPRLGGVLLDLETATGRYFNGCQYLRQGAVQRLGLPDAFTEFPHEYGGITALGNARTRLVDDCAQPALDGEARLCTEPPILGSALQRLHAYGPHAPQLIAWAQAFGDLEQLDWRCLVPMQLSRLHFPDDPQVASQKLESQRANELLAVPRRQRGRPAEAAWLPIAGYTALFDWLHQSLLDLGVGIRLQSPVTPTIASGRFGLRSRSETIAADTFVWTANPLPLFNRLYGMRLDTPPIPMKLLVGDLHQRTALPVPLPYYWQVFDSGSCVVRLYIYELGGALRYSAETFDTVDDASAWRDLQRVMRQCGLGDGHHLAGVVKQRRHVNFTSEEFRAFETLVPDLLQHGVVPGGWQHYGREEKVDSILPLIDRCLQSRSEASYA